MSPFLERFVPLFVFTLIACAVAACASAERTSSRTNSPPPYRYTHELRHNPNMSLHVVTVDLSDPRVSLHVDRGGADPDGDGKWTTTLMTVPAVAKRDAFDIAINGDFFSAQNTKDIEGKNTGYVSGKWGTPLGPAVTDGILWAPPSTTRPAIAVDPTRRAAIYVFDPKRKFPAGFSQVIAGNQVLVRAGAKVPSKNNDRHPRTVVGIDRTGSHLIILVVDGRQKKLSIGMTYSELADEMLKLGAQEALNLDGGGSTTLVMRDGATGNYHIINKPSDGKPRAVANTLGIKIKGGLPTTRPQNHQ